MASEIHNRHLVIFELRAAQGDKSLRKYADQIGCSAAYLSDIYHGRREPGPKILRAIKIKREVETKITYKRWR